MGSEKDEEEASRLRASRWDKKEVSATEATAKRKGLPMMNLHAVVIRSPEEGRCRNSGITAKLFFQRIFMPIFMPLFMPLRRA